MDHKVSKDMISSGMIPSGEKTQSDLGRTQYGSAPSPNKLMDAYKSMYEKKEEVINEMAGKIPKITRLKPNLKAQSRAVKDSEFSDDFDRTMESGVKYSPEAEKIKQDKIKKGREAFRTGQKQENVDLLSAYHAVYEHHKKDADGNTIPHEGEEVNEAAPLLAAPLIAKGLMALKGTKAVTAAVKGAAAFKKGLTTAKAVGAAGKITTTGGKLASGTKKVGMMQKAGSGLRSAGASIKNNPTNTALVGSMAIPQGRGSAPQSAGEVQQTKLGRRTAGMYNDVDLFDIVKGQLLDEGLNEKEVMDVMTTLTIDEINEVINVEESLAKLALKTGAIVTGGVLAKKGLEKAKQSFDNQINKARDKSPIGGNKRPGSDKIYFGK